MKKAKVYILLLTLYSYCFAQNLPPKQAYPLTTKQIHSGHSLTDPLFYPHWPGQYVNLMALVLNKPAWQLIDKSIGKSTIPGSSLANRWQNGPSNGSPNAKSDIHNWELLSITERVPLLYDGGSSEQWYIQGIKDQRSTFSLFVNNAWTNGNQGKGAATLLWSTWVQIDGSNGPFREMLDIQGIEWEKMQDYANQQRPSGAPPIYMIPGHKMMARLYDDIQKGIVPGITKLNQLFSDQIHTNELGAYAIAMIHYACIYNMNPVGLTNNLLPNANTETKIPSKEFANYIQNMVWDVVTHYERTGIRVSASTHKESFEHSYVYPNPATEMLNINQSGKKEKIIIYDVLGNVVFNGYDENINIISFPVGIYFLSIGQERLYFLKQ